MSPNADPPPPKSIKGALWAKIIGAVIAIILFSAFLVLGGLASVREDVVFNCNSFSFLAPAFAIGAAMAAMFLGGGAAVAGNLGERLQGQALAVSLSGGVAVLVIMFGIFFGLRPEGCGADQAEIQLEFREVPDAVSVYPGARLWTRQNTHRDKDDYEVLVLVTGDISQQEFALRRDGVEICSLDLTFAPSFGPEMEGMDYEVFEMPDGDSFKLRYALRLSGELVETTGCFTYQGQRAEVELAVAVETGQVRFARRIITDAPSVEEFAGGPAVPVVAAEPGFSLIAAAHAASLGTPYDQLRDLLMSGNEGLRVEARRVLSADFATYADAALADLFNPRTKRNAELLTSLLSGLIAGIETADPALAPAAGRDLSRRLPYIAGREGEIVALAAHPDGSVRQQARRLMQRFPVDAFIGPVTDAVAQAEAAQASGACPQDRAGHQVYAAVFFTYNRMIQAGLDGTLSRGPDWAAQANRLQSLAETCIEGVEKADAALLDYGLALAHAWAGDERLSRQAVADFASYLEGREADYYMQGHRDRMTDLWK